MAKPRIVILNPSCLDVLERHRAWLDALRIDWVADEAFRRLQAEEVGRVLDRAQALILPSVIRPLPAAEVMACHPSLRVLSIAASGYDWLDVAAATRCGIVVANALCPEGGEVVADLAIGLMLAVARQIPHHDRLLREGKAERGLGVALAGKTLGIVGLGNIGRCVARRAAGFGMRILATDPQPDRPFVAKHRIRVLSLEELLRSADFVSLHVRLNDGTRRMIGARELARMKPTAFLVNTARQELVDEKALADALVNRRLAGAAIDDPPSEDGSPLLRMPNFVCTPHLGNRAIEGVDAVFRCAMENAIAVIEGRRPAFVVNPEVYSGHGCAI